MGNLCGGKNLDAVSNDDSSSSHHDNPPYGYRQGLGYEKERPPSSGGFGPPSSGGCSTYAPPHSGGFAQPPSGGYGGYAPPASLPYQQGVPTSQYGYSGGGGGAVYHTPARNY